MHHRSAPVAAVLALAALSGCSDQSVASTTPVQAVDPSAAVEAPPTAMTPRPFTVDAAALQTPPPPLGNIDLNVVRGRGAGVAVIPDPLTPGGPKDFGTDGSEPAVSGEDLASYAADPPSDRTDPVAVAAYVATAWTSRSLSSMPWIDERGGWVTPELAAAARALSGEAAVRADLTSGSQVVNLDAFSQAGQITSRCRAGPTAREGGSHRTPVGSRCRHDDRRHRRLARCLAGALMIAKATVAGIAIMAIPLLVLFGLVAVVAGAASGSGAAAGHATFNPSVEAIDDIAPGLIDLYVRSATSCVGLPWQVVAAIAKVESNHGRHGGSTITASGAVVPPIIGIALNGTGETSAISDTDDGRLDGDSVWDRAVGPFQFIPSSWAIFGQDADDDGARNPQNMLDAAAAAVAHLCPTHAITDLEAAIFAYNHSDAYVTAVLDWARRYTGPLASVGPVVEGYAFPLPPAFATAAAVTRSHHDYPAIDVATPTEP